MIPFCFVVFQMVVGLVRPQAGKSLVWSRWFRHRILHFKYMHLVCEIDETQKLSAATGIIPVVSSCARALGTSPTMCGVAEALANS